MVWVMRCLALLHFTWGILLLVVAAFFGVGMLRVLPHLSSGNIWTNLSWVLLMAAGYALPFALLGFWMIVLGRWVWTLRPRFRLALLITHGVMLLPGTLSVFTGIHAMRAAERSTASGGGIMSPLAALPVVFGVPVVVLALCSIAVALTAGPAIRESKQDYD